MPVELNIVETVTELDTTVVTVVLESASEPGPAGPGVAAGGTAGQVLTKDSGTDYDTSWQDATGGGGSGEATVVEVTQTAHGFSVGDWLTRDSGDYALAQADSAANAEVYGVVSAVADANTFDLTTNGLVEGLAGLTADAPHFLHPDNPGELTDTAPTTSGDVSKPVLLAVDGNSGFVANMRGIVVPASVGGGGGGLHDAYAFLRDEKTANTGGGTFTSGAWRTRDLNTETDPDGIVTLSANQFTPAAGTYLISARAPCYSAVGARHKAKLRNATDSTDTIVGASAYCGGDEQTDAWVIGRFTTDGTKAYEVQHTTQTTEATIGFGVASNFAVVEVYTEVQLWREAA